MYPVVVPVTLELVLDRRKQLNILNKALIFKI
jgi:hypothetical protein